MSYQLCAADLGEAPDVAAPGMLPNAPGVQLQKKVNGAGLFCISSFALPHIQVSDFYWRSEDDVVLHDHTYSNTIDINFQLQGYLHSEFNSIGILPMKTGCHNMIHAMDKNTHQVARGTDLRMFHLSLSKDFFREMIGCDNAWSDTMLAKLDKGQPFRAVEGVRSVTPAMLQLIQSVQNNSWQGSIRFLQLQSKIYELLALQLEQFTTSAKKKTDFSKADEEKLYLVKQYLQQHFLEELSLTKLCQVAMLNEFKLKKGFKQLFGTTVFGYVKILQM